MYTGRKLFYVNRGLQIKVPTAGGHFEEKPSQFEQKKRSPHGAASVSTMAE